jgi:hypothetical protein
MNNSITYDRTKQFGQMTAELVTAVVNARDLANRIRAKLDQMDAGNTPGNIEGDALFGVAAGQGDDFYVALGYVRDGLNNIAGDKLSDLDYGG